MSDAMPFFNDHPELVFGLVGPIGVRLEFAQQALADALREFGYQPHLVKVTETMLEMDVDLQVVERPTYERYMTRIAYANRLRESTKSNSVMAMIAISAIRKKRSEIGLETSKPANTAYIVRQFKTPEEIALMRSVYGRQFVQVSVWGSEADREQFLIDQIKEDARGLLSDLEAKHQAKSLIATDSKQPISEGQNVRDCFPLGDVFIEGMDRERCFEPIRRFISALFGSNLISPTHDEYGMYIAKSASLRSSDLSRQVGSAIFAKTGEVISLGSNEVPKAGGGTYWTGDEPDARDFVLGQDPNEAKKREIIADLLHTLSQGGILGDKFKEENVFHELVSDLLDGTKKNLLKSTKIMDLIEFGRIIHAEMSAISDAARRGVSIQDSVMYVTVFPCHLCAKHIVAAGISEVVYLEPYPKSYATELHRDSIEVERRTADTKILFRPFIGISPFRYRDLFEKGKRKYGAGKAQEWHKGTRRPMIENYSLSYLQAEDWAVLHLSELVREEARETSENGDGNAVDHDLTAASLDCSPNEDPASH